MFVCLGYGWVGCLTFLFFLYCTCPSGSCEVKQSDDKGSTNKKKKEITGSAEEEEYDAISAGNKRGSPDVTSAHEMSSVTKTVSGGGTKRRRSEDELELHPTIDWEEEGEGEGDTVERPTPRKQSRRSGVRSGDSKSVRRGGGGGDGESKVIQTSTGEGGDRERGRRRKVLVRGTGEEEKGDKPPATKRTRAVKVTCVHVTRYSKL